jgi:UDP-3-O-[3-hydroxymyristoyl] N-acetylglucosamine deacetylase
LPAAAGAGIVFRRDDMGGAEIPALYDRVGETRLGTVISEKGVSVAVVEHLMAAIAGTGVDDVLIALDGPEPPILDGDALSWLAVLERAGVREQPGTQNAIRIAKRIDVAEGNASAALMPADALELDFEISFLSATIGVQSLCWKFSGEAFRRDIAPARTFGFVDDLDALRAGGLGRGASLANTLAIDGDRVVNSELRRFPDEFVRHKILDALGDLALAGSRIVGRFEGRRSGHTLNNALLRKLFADPSNFELLEMP